MPTQIRQLGGENGQNIILAIEGDMLVDDAVLLERIAADIREKSGSDVTIDLADLSFLDSESAPILKRLGDRDGFRIEGIEIFLQSAVNTAERIR